ncbi:MAG: hypothetical protein M1826_003913 [Phylliscum demangeonii]|nr:MAG: hypothetical protein M1826_003913 [Phylliscum demangeonii]
MLDPFPAAPRFLAQAVQPLATALSLPTLPLHIHEVLFACALYQLIHVWASPRLSRRLFPHTYPRLERRARLGWDVHVVSLSQSLIVNSLALWVMWADDERRRLAWHGRLWGYTGASGLVQAFATGYFLWDLMVTARYVAVFGWGMLAHAVCALMVFSVGFRPFVNYYGPIFILYELSSPFLNFHWFFDKLQMTGSRPQLYNGIVLLATFFACRLVWGPYQTVRVFADVWTALRAASDAGPVRLSSTTGYNSSSSSSSSSIVRSVDPVAEVMRFAPVDREQAGGHAHFVVPLWLALVYLLANVVLTSLNFYWFNKMIDAVRKRFQPAPAPATEKTPAMANGETVMASAVSVQRDAQGHVRAVLDVERRRTTAR